MGLLGFALASQAVQTLPSFEQVRDEHGSSEARLVDRHGQPLAEIRLDPARRRLEWMALTDLSPAMKEALLVAEDRRFYQHAGIDWRAFVAALWQNLWYDRTRGASTLSMQLAGLIDPALHPMAGHGGRRTLGQKWDQALAATELERQWSKAQILEAYLNLAPFRGDLEGVPAAAWGLFKRGPAQLNRPEAAILAVLLRGPNAAPQLVGRRACVLLRRLGDGAACRGAEALAQGLAETRFQPRWALAPHAARALLSHPGEVRPSTLERSVQQHALTRLAGEGGPGAGVVMDNASGQILAHVGSVGGDGPDEALTRRPVGPVLLPIFYGLVLEQRLASAASLFEVDPTAHEPAWMSLRTALVSGAPGPTALLAARLPAGILEERLGSLGWSVTFPPAGGGPGEGVLADLPGLAAIFRGLAMGGQWQAPQWVMGPGSAPRRLLRVEAAFVVSQMLLVPETFGPERAAYGAPSPAGGGVAVAFDAATTVVLWLERGVEPALALAKRILAELPRAGGGFRPPAGVVAQWVSFDPPVEPPRREWFIKGSEVVVAKAPPRPARIVWPPSGQLVDVRSAMADPAYRLLFEARPPGPGLVWRLNGQVLGQGPQVRWRPETGLVRLELVGPDGAVLDSVEFALRGL